MQISAIEQEVSDLDWFAVDCEGHIATLSSAGGRLPPSAASSVEDNALLVDFFRSLAADSDEFLIGVAYQARADAQNHPVMNRIFFEHYAFYSVRGLFSFNRNETDTKGAWSDSEYSLVTMPPKPLSYEELPQHIQEIIGKTKYAAAFSISPLLDLRAVS
jgi:hypothetical protein